MQEGYSAGPAWAAWDSRNWKPGSRQQLSCGQVVCLVVWAAVMIILLITVKDMPDLSFLGMFWRRKPKKDHSLYYLLPGMNSGNRKRHKRMVRISILIGVVCAALFGMLIWQLNR